MGWRTHQVSFRAGIVVQKPDEALPTSRLSAHLVRMIAEWTPG